MARRLSIFHPPGRIGLGLNRFGKDVANLELYRALVQHGGFDRVDVLAMTPGTDKELVADLLEGQPCTTSLHSSSILNQRVAVEAGALLRGQPDLYELAWLRRRLASDRAFSLLGLVHTLAPPAIRHTIAMATSGPTHPWDAIICTSPSVRDAVTELYGAWGAHLAERTGGAPPPRPMLPVVPLGVDGPAFAAKADRHDARARMRASLGCAADDILVIWVGRLSFFEKAYPQPMFRAAQEAARATGAKVHFALAGWFPNPPEREYYEAAQAAHAPDVVTHYLDGNDQTAVGELWAAGDIFMSLVDNIQETFGITPIEAMAAGLPVVVSDWDGYRSTVRHGQDGFLIPTLGAPPGGLGANMAVRHVMEMESYQAYVGNLAQHTAVDVGAAADAITALIRSPDLRRTMGQSGRRRIAEAFDWPVIARQYHALVDELAAIRGVSVDPPTVAKLNPAKGDPFVDFKGFASRTLTLDLTLRVRNGQTAEHVLATRKIRLDAAFPAWRATLEESARAVTIVGEAGALPLRDLLMSYPVERRRAVELGVMWLAKQGFLAWGDA